MVGGDLSIEESLFTSHDHSRDRFSEPPGPIFGIYKCNFLQIRHSMSTITIGILLLTFTIIIALNSSLWELYIGIMYIVLY